MYNADKLKRVAKTLYTSDSNRKKVRAKEAYRADSEKKKAACTTASRIQYRANPNKKRVASRAIFQANPNKKRAASRAHYQAHSHRKKALVKAWCRAHREQKSALSRAYFAKNLSARAQLFRKYYARHKDDICLTRRDRYILSQPNTGDKERYLKSLQANLLNDFEARSELMKTFRKQHESVAKRIRRVLGRTACRLAARRLLHKALQVRKDHAGSLLKCITSIKSLQITQRADFGKGCHTMASEPFFYDSAYQHVKKDIAIPVNEDGQCVVAEELHNDDKKGTCRQIKKWECSRECKAVTDTEVDAILILKTAFEKPIQEVRQTLDTCDDGCPNGHYSKVIEFSFVGLQGHQLVCSTDGGGCLSKLKILRAASAHFPVLRQFLHGVHSAIRSFMCVFQIDKALCIGNYQNLMEIVVLGTECM